MGQPIAIWLAMKPPPSHRPTACKAPGVNETPRPSVESPATASFTGPETSVPPHQDCDRSSLFLSKPFANTPFSCDAEPSGSNVWVLKADFQ
jgi:hypothetical protein